jgi:hypothetical protein
MLRAVSDEQAAALREGKFFPKNLISPEKASSDGKGDITHLGCGCGLMMLALMFLVLPVFARLGGKAAIVAACFAAILSFGVAWDIRRKSRRKVDLKKLDPLTVIPDDCELCLNDWHGLHFLLTGTEWDGDSPENFLIHGGDALPEPSEAREYGPARIIPSNELPTIVAALKRLDLTDAVGLLERAAKTAAIHPGRFDKEYLEAEHRRLCRFVEAAIENRSSLVIEMC